MRSKTRVVHFDHSKDAYNGQVELVPEWNFDGSSTNQATTEHSEVILKPVAVFPDPFRTETFHRDTTCYLVLCDCYDANMTPVSSNTRMRAKAVFSDIGVQQHEPWYGLEQEYTVMSLDRKTPIAWTEGAKHDCIPQQQGQHYCGTVTVTDTCRRIAEEHLSKCLVAGLNMSGLNAEVLPGQWEFQVGPCLGLSAGDHMWMARYILLRVAEKYSAAISFNPKPVMGDWNGSGCHVNYSTKATRQEGGYEAIKRIISSLETDHVRIMKSPACDYGENNQARLTGKHETSSLSVFTSGVGSRAASVRIPYATEQQGCGYFEDRRPAANADPYIVTSYLFERTLGLG